VASNGAARLSQAKTATSPEDSPAIAAGGGQSVENAEDEEQPLTRGAPKGKGREEAGGGDEQDPCMGKPFLIL